MNRRELVVAGTAIAAVATLPVLPVMAQQRMFWTPGALLNPHADLVLDFIEKTLNEGCIYASQDHFFDLVIDLDDPVFHVDTGKPIWNCVRGYRDPEPEGLAVTLFEGPIEVLTLGIASTSGWDEYWHTKKERDMPPYFVKKPWLPYEEKRGVREALGKRVRYDNRWLDAALADFKKAKSAATVT